jgi:hypothetical protein
MSTKIEIEHSTSNGTLSIVTVQLHLETHGDKQVIGWYTEMYTNPENQTIKRWVKMHYTHYFDLLIFEAGEGLEMNNQEN